MFNASIMRGWLRKIQTNRAHWVQPILRLAHPGTLQSFYIPLLFQTFGRNKPVNNGVHHLSTEVGDGFANIICGQQTITLGVDQLTLIVSHIIVIEQAPTNIEVATFHLRWAFSMALVIMRCSKPQPEAHKCYVFLSVCYLISETKPLSEKSQLKIGGECFHDP